MITRHGWIVIAINAAIVALSIIQYVLAEQKQKDANDVAKKESDRRDSIIRADYANSVERITANYDAKAREIKNSADSNVRVLKGSYDTSTTNIIRALAVYGLKYDSAKNRIEKLVRDSLRSTPDPVLQLSPDNQITLVWTKDDTTMFKVHLMSSDAASRDFKIDAASCASNEMKGPYTFLGFRPLFYDRSKISTDMQVDIPYGLKGYRSTNLLFVWVYGTFKSLKSDTPIEMDVLIVYNYISNKSYVVSGNTELQVKAFLSKYIKK